MMWLRFKVDGRQMRGSCISVTTRKFWNWNIKKPARGSCLYIVTHDTMSCFSHISTPQTSDTLGRIG